MGNLLSNKSYYENNSLYVTCDPAFFRALLFKYQSDPEIQVLLDEIPFACNYVYNPRTYVTEINLFDNYQGCYKSLRFHLFNGLKFCPGSKILLKKQHHKAIMKFIRPQ